MKNKHNLTLAELIAIFCKERETMRQYIKDKFKAYTLDDDALIDYFIDKWIEDAKNCKNVSQFDQLIRSSLRMSFDDWFSTL